MSVQKLLPFLLLFYSPGVLCVDFYCNDILNSSSRLIEYSPHFIVTKDLNSYELKAQDHNYYFNAYLSPEGRLTLSIQLKNLETGARSHLLGTRIFNEMLTHFGKERVHIIAARWIEGSNYVHFFKELGNGASPVAAAISTWTGRMAVRHGYNHVQRIEINEVPFTGIPSVYVEFSRPNINESR